MVLQPTALLSMHKLYLHLCVNNYSLVCELYNFDCNCHDYYVLLPLFFFFCYFSRAFPRVFRYSSSRNVYNIGMFFLLLLYHSYSDYIPHWCWDAAKLCSICLILKRDSIERPWRCETKCIIFRIFSSWHFTILSYFYGSVSSLQLSK